MVPYHLVDVFRLDGAGGNPAGVVLAADGLDEAEMQRVATALDVSDTAFLFRAGGLRLRWFTPAREIALCGHATLATAHVLGVEQPVSFAYAGGQLEVRGQAVGGETLYWLSRPAPELAAFRGDPAPVLAALGEPRLDDELPLVRSADGDLLVPLADHAAVARLEPDHGALGAACTALDLRGVAALAVPGDGPHEVRLRFFAPHLGIPEDPATGSVHGAVVTYLHLTECFEHWPEELRALSHQGAPGGRECRLWLRLTIDPETNRPLTAEVGGTAVTVASGEL